MIEILEQNGWYLSRQKGVTSSTNILSKKGL